jgi:hypothetical protein
LARFVKRQLGRVVRPNLSGGAVSGKESVQLRAQCCRQQPSARVNHKSVVPATGLVILWVSAVCQLVQQFQLIV